MLNKLTKTASLHFPPPPCTTPNISSDLRDLQKWCLAIRGTSSCSTICSILAAPMPWWRPTQFTAPRRSPRRPFEPRSRRKLTARLPACTLTWLSVCGRAAAAAELTNWAWHDETTSEAIDANTRVDRYKCAMWRCSNVQRTGQLIAAARCSGLFIGTVHIPCAARSICICRASVRLSVPAQALSSKPAAEGLLPINQSITQFIDIWQLQGWISHTNH